MPLKFSHSVRIDSPPDRVFAVSTDLDAFARWMPNFVGVQLIRPANDQSEGEIGVGTQFKETRKMYGRDSTEHFEFTSYDPPSGFVLEVDGAKGTTGKGIFTFAHTLRPLDDGAATEFALAGEIGGMSKIAELFGRLFMGSMKKAIAADLASLKTYIEQLPEEPEVHSDALAEGDGGLADAAEPQEELVAGPDGLERNEGAGQDDLASE